MNWNVLALIVAGGSFCVSLYAVWVAKTGPDREQLRRIRETVRDAVVRAYRIAEQLNKRLDAGEVISAPGESLLSESRILKEHRGRFPAKESHQIDRAYIAIESLHSTWLLGSHQESFFTRLDRQLNELNSVGSEYYENKLDEELQGDLALLKQQKREASRSLDSVLVKLRSAIDETKKELTEYIEFSDRIDRRKTR